MIKMRRGWFIAGCVVILSFGACGGDEGGDDTSSAETPSEQQLDTLETLLKNAATAQETYAVDNFTYTDSVAELEAAGLNVPPESNLEVVTATETEYCLEASADDTVMHLDSASGNPQEGTC